MNEWSAMDEMSVLCTDVGSADETGMDGTVDANAIQDIATKMLSAGMRHVVLMVMERERVDGCSCEES